MPRVLNSRWWIVFNILVYGTIVMLFVDIYRTRVTYTQLQQEAPFLEAKGTIEARLTHCEARLDALKGKNP